jgi:TolA-binding protein
MKIFKKLYLAALVSALTAGATSVRAQETNQVEQLQKQLQQMQENFERVQREQAAQISALTQKLAEMAKQQMDDAEKKKLETQLAAELATTMTNEPPPAFSKTWSPSAPITVARAGSAYMNMSFDTMMVAGGSTASDPSAQLQLGDHDPQKNGFSLRNAEIALDGAVDPYFKGFANIVLKLDNNNETDIELEEAYAQSTSLPANLQVKAGQFFAAFGRQNAQHPHTWAFVDAPIILNRAFGPDGLRNVGAQGSWLLPLPFYTELFLGVFDGQGSTTFGFRNPGDPDPLGVNRFHGRATMDRGLRGPQDLVFTPRLASSFELTDQQTLVAGVSAAFGPNDTGANNGTQIYGVDLYWKWKAANAGEGFPFVSWQTEALYEIYEAGADATAVTPLPAETLRDWGAYSQVLWGFKPRWVVGLRGEYANGNSGAFDAQDIYRGERTRISPVLTFYPSEFSKIRLQYNYDQGEHFGSQHSIWLQMEFLLGAHGAHKF